MNDRLPVLIQRRRSDHARRSGARPSEKILEPRTKLLRQTLVSVAIQPQPAHLVRGARGQMLAFFWTISIVLILMVSLSLMKTPKGLAFVQRHLVVLTCSGMGMLCLGFAAIFVAAGLFGDSIRAAQLSDAVLYRAFAIWMGILQAGLFLLITPAALVFFPPLRRRSWPW